MKTYVVWSDYGSDGWQPNAFDTKEEAINYILEDRYSKCILTKQLELSVKESE